MPACSQIVLDRWLVIFIWMFLFFVSGAWWQIILDRLCFLIFFSLIIYLYMKQRESTRLIDNFER